MVANMVKERIERAKALVQVAKPGSNGVRPFKETPGVKQRHLVDEP